MWRFLKSRDVKGNMTEHNAGSLGRRRNVITRTVAIWTERVLLVSGLALVIVYGAARLEGWLVSRAAIEKFAAVEVAESRAESRSEPSSDKLADESSSPDLPTDELAKSSGQLEQPNIAPPNIDFSLWGQRRIKAYKQIENAKRVPLAVLSIPKIRLEAPLFDGTDDLTLNHGVGRIAGTSRPEEGGNIGVAGHRDGFFRGLKDVSVGDAIELKTRKGTATYIVDRIQIVTPRQVEVLRQTPVPSLTLVTCYPFYFFGSAPQRYIVTAFLSQEKNGEAEKANLGAPATSGNSTQSSSTQFSSTQSSSTRRKQMNLIRKASFFGKGAGAIALALAFIGTAAAQDSTVTTIAHGQPSYEAQVKNAEVVYVEGNDLVLKLENGRVEHLVAPNSDKFTIDGEEVSVQHLVPGTKLTQTITTTTTPRYVNTVRTIEGKVWHVNAPKSLILALPDHTNQIFAVPDQAKFTVNGQEKTVFDLKKGMNIKATIVTDEEHTVIESNKVAVGRAPRIIATPREMGVLLFAMPQPPVMLADAGKTAETLPETGSSLLLFGLVGALAIAMSLGVRAVRQTRTI